jgi:uncharacterized membrane protein YdbT with pleckstrin-like domain
MSKLLPGENLVLKAHPHWITIVRSLLLPVALFVLIALADFSVLNPDNFYVPKLRTFLSLGVVALAILWFIVVWIRWQSTTYTLTDQRIKIERGIFSRQEKLIAVDRVQDVSTRQSILGRVLGYGNVQIESAGEVGSEVFSSLPEPDRFRDQVFIQSEARRGGPAPAAAPSPVAANPSGV